MANEIEDLKTILREYAREDAEEETAEPVYELRPGLRRCTHRMRVSGNQCQLAEGHDGRHVHEPTDEPSICRCDCHSSDAGGLVCSRCAPNHGPRADD